MKKQILALFFLLTTLNLDAKIKHIFIDINLLVDTSTSAASKEVGTWNSTKYLARMGKIPNKTDFFKSLKNCPAQTTELTYNEDILMPLILSDWLLGLQSNQTIKNTIFKYLDKSSLCDIEKTIFKNISNMMLTPVTFINTQYLRKDITKIIQHLHKSGQCTVHLIGNWDKESEPMLLKMLHHHSLMSPQNCLFSNKLKHLKPHADYFDALLDHCDFDVKECMVIDVESKHAQGAKKAGFTSILVHGQNAVQLKSELTKHGIRL